MQADVTVVMPAKDRAHLIHRSLGSIAAQTVQPREVVVVDDGSSDDTAEVARGYGARVLRLPVNEGIPRARNHGVRAAGTTWIAFLDSDDEWLPEHLGRLLERAGSHDLVAAPARSTSGRILGNSTAADIELTAAALLSPGDLVVTSGTLVRREALLEAGLFRPLPRAEDLDMWVRLLTRGSGLSLSGPTVVYTEHEGQSIHDRDLMRRCVEEIMEESLGTVLPTRRDLDRAMSRMRWDDLRAAQRERDAPSAARHAGWLLSRPHTWATLLDVLRRRRLSRRAGAGADEPGPALTS